MIEVEVEVKVGDHIIQLLVEDISLAPYLNYLYKLYAFEKKKIHQPIYKYKKKFFVSNTGYLRINTGIYMLPG